MSFTVLNYSLKQVQRGHVFYERSNVGDDNKTDFQRESDQVACIY